MATRGKPLSEGAPLKIDLIRLAVGTFPAFLQDFRRFGSRFLADLRMMVTLNLATPCLVLFTELPPRHEVSSQ